MSYLIRYIRDKETIAIEESDEHPDEEYLRTQVEATNADFADVCRNDE